jgi:hypothetical protein
MSNNKDLIDGIAIIGFRIFSDNIDLYTLITYGRTDQDFALTFDNRIIFFDSIKLASKAYNLFDDSIKQVASIPNNVELVCDITSAVNLIKYKTVDNSATILNCLNTFFDLLLAVNTEIPKKYKKILYDFADYLTCDTDLHIFFGKSKNKRNKILEAFTWCIGAIILSSKVLR